MVDKLKGSFGVPSVRSSINGRWRSTLPYRLIFGVNNESNSDKELEDVFCEVVNWLTFSVSSLKSMSGISVSGDPESTFTFAEYGYVVLRFLAACDEDDSHEDGNFLSFFNSFLLSFFSLE